MVGRKTNCLRNTQDDIPTAKENMSESILKPTNEPEHTEENPFQPQFMAVGIGASAGGLEALKTFFEHTPADTGMAFVVVVHLSPEHPSHLPELLQTYTQMPVTQVTETIKMEPDHVYVIPPNRNLSAIDTHLRLTELEESRRQRAPIDHFFRTLAQAHGEKAIGIVLSGTGADGSIGLKQIKEEGGLTVVQDPREAQYDSMPQNAIITGLIDLVLPAAEMGGQIRDFLHVQPRLPDEVVQEDLPNTNEGWLQKILAQLHSHTGHDFSAYKRTTIGRRLRRRMQLQQVEELPAYWQLLQQNPAEARLLFRDLLITVTNFFRDAGTFAALETQVIPQLFAGKTREDTVRVWVTGCATGEEAYSLAILLLEQRSQLDDAPEIQIFASDVSSEALAHAREGFYSSAISGDVSPERLERFFHEENGGYRLKKEVREMILFADHNLLNDPPFSKLDLVSCRNLLIYLQREVQDKIMGLFHYALRPGGFLFLGASESLFSAALFRAIDKKRGLYQRQSVTSAQPALPSLPLAPWSRPLTKTAENQEVADPSERDSFGALHQEIVERYAPPSLLVNQDFDIVHLSQHAGRFLHTPGGEPTNSVLQRINPALRPELTTALYGALEKDQPSSTRPVRMTLDGEMRRVSMNVQPAAAADMAGHVLVVFMEMEDAPESTRETSVGEAARSMAQELDEDLTRTKERLQTAVEEFETSREEMRASNEELQSMNEELRSTAEELETSKEELQSMNEELLTVDQENKNKVAELSQLSGDLHDLLLAADAATLFLDQDLRIRQFTPQVGQLFNIMPADQGRPLSHITHNLQGGDLLQDANRVLQHLTSVEREMSSQDGRWFLVQLRPYRSEDEHIGGIVITFVDITEMKQVEEELRRSKAFQEYIVQTVREALLVLNLDLTVAFANLSFYRMFQVEEESTVGTLVYELGNGQWDIPALRLLLEDVLPDNDAFNDYEVTHSFQEVGERVMLLNARRLDGQQLILLAVEDVTERHQALAELQRLNKNLGKEVGQRTRKIRQLASELLVAEQKVRRRIAQALHDDLQQIIYSMRMQLQMLKEDVMADEKTALMPTMTHLDEMMNNAFTMTRQMARELAPPIPLSEDFGESMHELGLHVSQMHRLQVNVQVNGSVHIEKSEISMLLLYIVRELLFNIVKHAEVDEANVEVSQQENALQIVVTDGGKGFDVTKLMKKSGGSGFGLYSIQERLELVDGRLEVVSKVGDGTRVALIIPQDGNWQMS